MLVKHVDLTRLHFELLSKNWYRLHRFTASFTLQDHFAALKPIYDGLVIRLCEFAPEHKRSECMSSLKRGYQGLVASMQSTIKDHKQPGLVSARPIHNASQHPFEGIARPLTKLLDKRTRKFKHVCISTNDFLEKLCKLRFPSTARIVHRDVDDFYMSGTCDHHVRFGCGVLSGKPALKQWGIEAVRLLLNNQFIKSVAIADIYRMIVGTGQGCFHSAALASSSFLYSHELNGLGIATQSFAQKFGILLYLRFADNLFFIVDTAANETRLCSTLLSFPPYSTKLEEASSDGVDFLDVHVSKRYLDSYCMFDFMPIVKNKGAMLSPLSSHRHNVHIAGPLSQLRRLWHHSSRISYFACAKKDFLQACLNSGFSTDFVQFFDSSSLYVSACISRDGARKSSTGKILWCVLPYHPFFAACNLGKRVAQHFASPAGASFLSSCGFSCIRISWKHTTPAFGSTLIRWR